MFEFIGTVVNFVTIPLAIYGAWALLGLPYTDQVTALGRKALTWITTKISG